MFFNLNKIFIITLYFIIFFFILFFNIFCTAFLVINLFTILVIADNDKDFNKRDELDILIDYLRYGKVDFIGIAPLIECIFFSVYFFINVRDGIKLTPKLVNIFSFVIFLNILFEILLYFRDIGAGISYGAFRANVAGIVINRNPSFFYPIFAFVILRYVSLNYWVKIFYYLIFFIYVLTLFYRTLYVALLFPFVVEAFRFGMSLSIKSIVKIFSIVLLILVGVFFLDSLFESEFNFSIL